MCHPYNALQLLTKAIPTATPSLNLQCQLPRRKRVAGAWDHQHRQVACHSDLGLCFPCFGALSNYWKSISNSILEEPLQKITAAVHEGHFSRALGDGQ